MKKTLCLVFSVFIFLGSIVTVNADEPSSWAIEEVTAGIELGLVPQTLQKNYTNPISRGQVADMIVNLIEKASGVDIGYLLYEKGLYIDQNVFSDTSDYSVLAANALGIINGTGDHKFSPEGTLKRAQIAAIINRIASAMGITTTGCSHSFTDITGNYSWAYGELGWPVSKGIIKGVGGTLFAPGGDLTTEQAILITYRAFKVLTNQTISNYETETTPIQVIEVYHLEEPCPNYPDETIFNRIYTIPAINSTSYGASSVNKEIYDFCSREIDNNRKEDGLVGRLTYSYQIYQNIIAINVRSNAYYAYSDTGWINNKLFYYDSRNDKQIGVGDYVEALGYDLARLTAAITKTDQYITFTTPYPDGSGGYDWLVYNVSVVGILIGDETSEVVLIYDYQDWNGMGKGRSHTLSIQTDSLIHIYNQTD